MCNSKDSKKLTVGCALELIVVAAVIYPLIGVGIFMFLRAMYFLVKWEIMGL